MFNTIRHFLDTALDTVHRTLASRKALATLTVVVAALRSGDVPVAAGAVVAYLAAEGYIDSKSV